MAFANVQINLNDIDTDDLIEEIESRDYRVMMPGEIDEDVEALHRTLDDIHKLYLDYVSGGIPVERLKKFFEDTIDMRIV